MSGVLLILSNVRMDRDVIERAIAEARELDQELIVFVALDPAIATKVASQFLESGSIGPRPSQGFLDSLSKRHEQLALQAADEVVREAREKGVPARSVVRRGDYDKETAEVAHLEHPSTVVVEKRRRSMLRFVVGDTLIDELAKKLDFRLIEV